MIDRKLNVYFVHKNEKSNLIYWHNVTWGGKDGFGTGFVRAAKLNGGDRHNTSPIDPDDYHIIPAMIFEVDGMIDAAQKKQFEPCIEDLQSDIIDRLLESVSVKQCAEILRHFQGMEKK